ncbi:unnamed protein product, partial [Ceratitis capitata]
CNREVLRIRQKYTMVKRLRPECNAMVVVVVVWRTTHKETNVCECHLLRIVK